MKTKTLFSALLGLALVGSTFAATTFTGVKVAKSEDAQLQGASALYPSIPKDQIEPYVPGDRIMSAASSRSMTAIWETLEHAEASECLACVPAVEELLYDANPRTREIAAWWLRRRVFGVYGENEVYQHLLQRLASDPSEKTRAYAAEALGEFLAKPGIAAVTDALKKDASPLVRAAAAKALGRLNSDGAGALAGGLADGDKTVRSAALTAAARVSAFSDASTVVRALEDADPAVRLRAVQLLDQMRAKDAAAALLRVAQNDPEWNVRGAACHALGTLGDAAARDTLSSIASNDASGIVRGQARIALRRL